jgi:multidrug efflux pump subunit AcrB
MQALAITLIIPISFIGLFLTYYITGVPFGTGGFAAMVLLAGLTVNSAIYILCQYNTLHGSSRHSSQHLRLYLTAFNHKIVPIFLTILSTILGMLPFLIDGPDEQPFWYSLAIGTVGGLSMSMILLLIFLPVSLTLRVNYNNDYLVNPI